MRDAVGLSLDQVGGEVLGTAARVVLTKDTATIVGDGSTQDVVTKRVAQIKTLLEVLLSESLPLLLIIRYPQLSFCMNWLARISLYLVLKRKFF